MGEACDVVVVGGGLGGLAAAALMARVGLRVVVLERASSLGGRAGTQEHGGFFFNEGAHALYRGGAARRVLDRLAVRPSGHQPPVSGLAVRKGRVHALPSAMGALLTTGLVGWGAKIQGARFFARLGGVDTAAIANVSWGDWVSAAMPDESMRATLDAFVRVSTYAHAPSLASAGATLDQLRLAQRPGVLYVNHGWRTIVDAVAEIARRGGAHLRTGAHVKCAERTPAGWRVAVDEGEIVTCRAVVLATGPATARSVIASEHLAAWASECIPARAACLDVGLSRLPDDRATFALGVDQPLYLSVHSRTADVAPEGAALVSTMKYLPGGAKTDPALDRAELEAWLDLLQPGWRKLVVETRWLPSMVAANALVTARGGGTRGRPGPAVPDAPGVFVVGDWVGGEGMLLDASLASAERAAAELTAQLEVANVA